jgi:hypothetical protein
MWRGTTMQVWAIAVRRGFLLADVRALLEQHLLTGVTVCRYPRRAHLISNPSLFVIRPASGIPGLVSSAGP